MTTRRGRQQLLNMVRSLRYSSLTQHSLIARVHAEARDYSVMSQHSMRLFPNTADGSLFVSVTHELWLLKKHGDSVSRQFT
jgi:hypothetical protein